MLLIAFSHKVLAIEELLWSDSRANNPDWGRLPVNVNDSRREKISHSMSFHTAKTLPAATDLVDNYERSSLQLVPLRFCR